MRAFGQLRTLAEGAVNFRYYGPSRHRSEFVGLDVSPFIEAIQHAKKHRGLAPS